MIPSPRTALSGRASVEQTELSTAYGLTILLVGNDPHVSNQLSDGLHEIEIVDDVLCLLPGEALSNYLERQYSNPSHRRAADVLIVAEECGATRGVELLRFIRTQPEYDALPIVLCGSQLSQKHSAERLNAGFCLMGSSSHELRKRLDEAIVRAMRLASLIPDAAWFKGLNLPIAHGGGLVPTPSIHAAHR